MNTGTVFCFSISPDASLAAMSCAQQVKPAWVRGKGRGRVRARARARARVGVRG